jgi:hypothetical protein
MEKRRPGIENTKNLGTYNGKYDKNPKIRYQFVTGES